MQKALSIAITCVATAAIWWGWQELNLLRGTVFWEFRLLVLLVGAFALLSLAEKLTVWLNGVIGTDDPH